MPQFDRIARVTVGPGTGSENAILVEQLRISFNVKKTSKVSTNKASIDIYGLNTSSRTLINNLDNILILEAGYRQDGGPEVLFIGNITKVMTVFQKAETITSIEVNDGSKVLRDTRVSLSYKAGTTVKTIMDELLPKFKIPIRFVDEQNASLKSFGNGFAAVGSAQVVLDKLADKIGYDWNIQNGELRLISKLGSDKTRVIKLTPSTGLINSPVKNLEAEGKANPSDTADGYELTCQLQPKIIPGGQIYVESKSFSTGTTFKVESVTHKGDNHRGDWVSTATVIAL